MKKTMLFAVFAIAVAAIIIAAEESAKQEDKPAPTYVGERRCKVCHLATFKAWEKTMHAHAFDTLKEEERKNPICIACHTTGYGAGGYENSETVVDLTGVQRGENGPCAGYGVQHERFCLEFSL